MTDFVGATVGEFMEGDEGDDVFVDEFFVFIALPETHIDLFALVDGVRRIGGIGRGFRKTGGVGVEISN